MRTHEKAMFADPTEDDEVAIVAKLLPGFCAGAASVIGVRSLAVQGENLRRERPQGDHAAIDKAIIEHQAALEVDDEPARDLTIEFERPVTKGSNSYLVGFVDIVVTFKIPSVWWSDILRTGSRRISIYIEVKPRTYSIGSVLRQIKTYRMTVGDSDALFCLASRGLTDDHAKILLAERIIPWQPTPQPPSFPSGFFRIPYGR